MITFTGKSVFGGIAIGQLFLYKKNENTIQRQHCEDVSGEIVRYEAAKEKAIVQLKSLYEKALKEAGEDNAMIFDVHQMMLEDLDYNDSIVNIIQSQQVNAEYAVGQTGDNFSAMFSAMDDAYMQGRAADVKDITERVISILMNSQSDSASFESPIIIAAEDLAPSETVQFDKEKVLAFVTRKGSSNSHTAILARTMDIPAIIQAEFELLPEYNGKTAIVDGFTGTVYIDPDEEIIRKMKKKQEKDLEQKMLLHTLKGKENITLDGKIINIYANIGDLKDVHSVLQNDAGGIGLFRSEFIYLENKDYPTEEEQFRIYKTVVENMAGKKVIIRTLDIGADKQAEYFQLEKEENPALGYRAIRICLDRTEIFKTQLRALYRASAYGQLSIMFPMIISLQEVKEIKILVAEVQKELEEMQIPFKQVELGIMVETPAAAMISDILAKEVDFFSIGTNDLTQYTLAIDRQNQKLDKIYDSHHPAVLRLIQMVIENGHKSGIWVGICGELAADLTLTETFLDFGVDELSVSPGLILGLRKKVRETNLSAHVIA